MFAFKSFYLNKLTKGFYSSLKIKKQICTNKPSISVLNQNSTNRMRNFLKSNNLFNKKQTPLAQQSLNFYSSSTDNKLPSETKIELSSKPLKDLIIEHHDEGIVEMKLNRLEGKNSLSKNMLSEIECFVEGIKRDKKARCIVISSSIQGVFCAGADLKERLKMHIDEVGPFVSRIRRVFDEVAKIKIPVIAAIDGVALGGGLELALAADFIVSSSVAKLGLVETRLAIIPGAGGTQRLSRLIGVAKAKELIYTAKIIDGNEAKELGLVNYSVKQNEQGNAAYLQALQLAKDISNNGPIAIQMAKLSIDTGIEVDIQSGFKVEEICYSKLIHTKDRIEGLEAFKAKRPPKYLGE